MAAQPLALEWLVFIRDHGKDLKLTLGERALASLLPTYGQGKNITVTMSGIAKVTGWSRTTVIKHRDGLLAKGLIEDVTGNPKSQRRVYKLVTPGYVTTEPVQILDGGLQILNTNCSGIEHNIKRHQEVDHDHELDPGGKLRIAEGIGHSLATKSSSVRSSSARRRVPVPPIAPTPGPHVSGVWDERNRGFLAGCLGVSLESIDEPFWSFLESLGLDLDDDMHNDAIYRAHRVSSTKTNPVGYFQKILPGFIAERAA